LVFCSLLKLKVTEMQLTVAVTKAASNPKGLKRLTSFNFPSSLDSVSDLRLVKKHLLPMFQEVMEASIHSHSGYIVETQPGFYLVAFHKSMAAIAWAVFRKS